MERKNRNKEKRQQLQRRFDTVRHEVVDTCKDLTCNHYTVDYCIQTWLCQYYTGAARAASVAPIIAIPISARFRTGAPSTCALETLVRTRQPPNTRHDLGSPAFCCRLAATAIDLASVYNHQLRRRVARSKQVIF